MTNGFVVTDGSSARHRSPLLISLRILILLSVLPVQPVAADVVLPARLVISEAEPGTYSVTFTLPIVEGRKLRATPVLPESCQDLGQRVSSASSLGYTTSWTTRCEPASLAGELVFIDGLLGGQTELAFNLDTLEGRKYTGILRPSRPGFIVPQPPLRRTLAFEGTIEGLRRVLCDLPLWLFVFVAVLSGSRWRSLIGAVGAFALSHALAQWLGGQTWLVVPISIRDVLTLLIVVVPAAAIAGSTVRWQCWLRPLWLVAALLGALLGGARPDALPPDGLTRAEQMVAVTFFGAGVAAGLVLIATICKEIDTLVRLARDEQRRNGARRLLSYAVGIAAVAALAPRLVTLVLLPEGTTPASIELYAFALLSGLTITTMESYRSWLPVAYVVLVASGGAFGILRIPIPLGSTVVLGSLLLIGITLAIARPLPWRALALTALVALPAHGWAAAAHLVDTTSRSTGVAAGVGLVSLFALFAGIASARPIDDGRLWYGTRLLGAGGALFAVASRLGEYGNWIDRDVATEAALGMLRVPVLAFVTLVIGIALWPKRRRVVEELGMETRQRSAHWVLLAVAFLLLPYGTLTARNPFFEPHAPRGDDARRVATRVLSSTYEAFNLEDENALYDRLAESVTVDLIDDIYLDSRRRLTAGTRTGARVTVREVTVLEIGEPRDNNPTVAEYEYACRWVVVARVSHLQHVHHRRNLYNGILTLRADGGHWKIARLELLSEDRSVIPGNPL